MISASRVECERKISKLSLSTDVAASIARKSLWNIGETSATLFLTCDSVIKGIQDCFPFYIFSTHKLRRT